MTMKIHELAKELSMNSKELLEKVNAMGIDATSHMSGLTEEQAILVRNAVNKSKSNTETKIVKATPKKVDKKEETEEPKVIVKKATNLTISPAVVKQQAKPAVSKQAAERPAVTQKPPIGKPVPRGAEPIKAKPPIGKPMPKDFSLEKKEEKKEPVKEAPIAEASKQEMKPAVEENNTAKSGVPEFGGAQKLKIIKKFDAEEEKARREAEEQRREQNRRELGNEDGRDYQKRVNRSSESRDFQRRDNRNSEGRDFQRRDNRNSDGKDFQKRDNRNGDGKGFTRRDNKNSEGRVQDKDSDVKSGERKNFQRNDRNDKNRDAEAAMGPMVSKPQIKREDKDKDKDKDRDKFSKLEKGGNGKKNQNKIKTLEKAPKPKKHQQKPKVVEEENLMEELPVGTKVVNVPITVAGFCEQLEISTSTVIMKLMKLGIMANINQNIDEDTVLVLAEELGIDVVIGKVEEEAVEEGIETFEDKEEDLKPRAPIVTVMGHVDHGKTSLLDAIRKTNVTASESGGITQHIGASEVTINGNKIVFLDTPGHEAFTAMRARGAHGADIAILVVAADDSVKPQTIESISHAKAAGVPIIVAINKIDKPGANPDRVKQDLTEHGILVEDWGGDTIAVPVSAKSGDGIINLLEMVLLQAEVMELKANPSRLALGTVIEARLDKAKGPVATLLVTNGTLQSGTSIVAGTCAGRIRHMTNFKGDMIRKAGPSTAVEILGLTEVPQAGDVFNAVKEDKVARNIAESRKEKLREEVLARNASTTLEQLFSQIQEGEVKELNLIIKGDVQGSVGALQASLEKLKNENVRVKIIHAGVGTITESDVMLAGTAGAVIIGFNVRPSAAVTGMADREGIEIRTYRVIYDVIDDVENAMKGMLDPEFKEEILGTVEVRTTFKVPGVGTIAGAYVLEGKVVRNAEIRLVRDGIVYHEGRISSLKRFKDDAKEVQHGFECGIGFENYNDLKEGDIIECFHMVEVERK